MRRAVVVLLTGVAAVLAAPDLRAQQGVAPPGSCVGDSTSGAPVEAGADATPFARADVKAVAERIVCYCGCPHLQISKCFCGTADQVRTDIAARLDRGETPDAIVAAYTAEHGTWSLATPPKRGFNWIIWIGPGVLVVAGAIALLVVGRSWSSRRSALAAVAPPVDPEAEERHREQLRRLVEEP